LCKRNSAPFKEFQGVVRISLSGKALNYGDVHRERGVKATLFCVAQYHLTFIHVLPQQILAKQQRQSAAQGLGFVRLKDTFIEPAADATMSRISMPRLCALNPRTRRWS
jgi:hypothetical protein